MYNSKYSSQVSLSWLESAACSIIKCGQIPRHIGFIMDGNRRYAQKSGVNKTDGHKQGFDKLSNVLSWCSKLGINHVTLYAFSVENFKRSSNEIESIMDLARQKCNTLLEEVDQVNEAGIRVRVAGDLSLLPQDLREKIEDIQNMTRDNNRAYLNICLAYTSRHELVGVIKDLAESVKNRNLDPDEVNINMFESKLWIPRPFPDLIIRTSGEVRLSDFLLWQCQDSILIFVDSLWPEITIWDLMKAIFHYQSIKRCSPIKN